MFCPSQSSRNSGYFVTLFESLDLNINNRLLAFLDLKVWVSSKSAEKNITPSIKSRICILNKLKLEFLKICNFFKVNDLYYAESTCQTADSHVAVRVRDQQLLGSCAIALRAIRTRVEQQWINHTWSN